MQLIDQYLYDLKFGISSQVKQDSSSDVESALSIVDQKIQDGRIGFINSLNILNQDYLLSCCQSILENIFWAKTMVVIGIGGSDLGARVISQVLDQHQGMEVLFFGDTTDPTQIEKMLHQVDLSKTVFNVVSKSGKTIETLTHYLFLKDLLLQQFSNWQEHFIFTTSAESGFLYQQANKYGIPMVEIPEDVGGRFSVLTPVGLLPALAMGIDVSSLLDGARKQLNDAKIAKKIATSQYQLYLSGIKQVVIMPYSSQLTEFGRWFRQLWAESLGKEGKGILPISSQGPADQHSQLQFYTQGPISTSLLFIQVLNFDHDFIIDNVDEAEFHYLEGIKFSQIVNAEARATAQSLAAIGRPSATLQLNKLDAFALGELFIIFELAVVYLAQMLGVNPFDQPGVEHSKILIKEMLGASK